MDIASLPAPPETQGIGICEIPPEPGQPKSFSATLAHIGVVQKALGKLQIQPPGEGPDALSVGMPSWQKYIPVQAAGEDH